MGSDVAGEPMGAARRVPSVGPAAPARQANAGIVRYVETKMSRPRVSEAEIWRQRLVDRLDAGAQRPVTVVCAGAGWGKTMLASAWADTASVDVRWLSLGRQDNDVQVFWSHVVAAVRTGDGVSRGNPLAELTSIPGDDVERIRLLERGLGSLPVPTVLVLDDLHEIDDPKIMKDLSVLVAHPSPALRWVLLARAEPALPLHRLRAAGRVAEIRTADLAFTAAETAQLLAGHGVALSDEDATTLRAKTEGWAAGLRLAAAFLTGRHRQRVADFGGDLQAVDDYLADEVLAGHSPDVRRFLLQTSVCEQVNAELAEALVPGTPGQRMLEELERANDFVVRLGPKPRWFRYHPLLRDVLLHRMHRDAPGQVPQLHRRAAGWYAAHDSIVDALQHAAAARDWPYVGRLVVSHAAPQIVSTHRAALAQVLQRVPAEALSTTAELMTCAALRLFHAGDYDAIPQHRAAALALLRDRPSAERAAVEVTLQSLQIAVHRVRADMPAVIDASERLLTLLAGVRFPELPSAQQHRAIALNNKGVGLLWMEQPELADRLLWPAATAARTSGVELPEINALGHLALLEAMHGSVREAARLAGDARELAERRGWWSALQTVPAHLAQALVDLERNDLPAAQRALQHGHVAHRIDPEAAQWSVSCGVRARLALARGEPATAAAFLAQAHRPASSHARAPAIDRWLLLAESEVDLACGRPERVVQRYARVAGEPTYPERVLLIRAAYAKRDFRTAERLLDEPRPRLPHVAATVEAFILAALVADATGRTARSREALAAAVALAEQESVIRPFRTVRDRRLAALLTDDSVAITQNGPFIRDLLGQTAAGAGRAPGFLPLDAFNEPEQELLRYLPTMLTAREIASFLDVSMNAVKAHLRSIYRKLNATRRHDAVTEARRRGLI
jgi:LuxR family transcriptional regulator, maltose regulon positive regulatory protein